MEIKIKEPVSVQNPKGAWELEVKFMEGDADGYSFVRKTFSPEILLDEKTKKNFQEFAEFIQAAVEQDSKGRGGFEDFDELFEEYGNLPGFRRFCLNITFNLEEYLEEGGKNPLNLSLEDVDHFWAIEIPQSDYPWYDSFDDFKVYWYSETGEKFDCEIV